VRAKAPDRARTLAEQASVDAELAEIETQAAQAQAIASQLRQQVEQQPRGSREAATVPEAAARRCGS
jgi:hypothetical protein